MNNPKSSAAASRPLAGKTALLTGAGKNIGRAIALAFAEAGADVAITYRESEAEAQQTCGDLRRHDTRALAVPCDVRDEASIHSAVTQVLGEFHRLDLLVNNAAIFETIPLEQITAAQWDSLFATNTRGPFLVAKAAHAALKSSHGRILNIGSLGGIYPWATHAHYCSSKAALHMLSKTMAKAWAPEISVNCIAPGMIVTGDEPAAAYESIAARTPMRRNGTPADIAAAALFFATAPHFITGQLLAVDGGLGL